MLLTVLFACTHEAALYGTGSFLQESDESVMRIIDRLWSTAQCRIAQRMVVGGQVLLSNRILVPPSGLSYEPTQDTFASDSGIFVGHSWLAWPIFHADKERVSTDVGKKDDPMVSWTHVLDSKTYSGPIVSYVPEFFTRRWKQWCEMRSQRRPESRLAIRRQDW